MLVVARLLRKVVAGDAVDAGVVFMKNGVCRNDEMFAVELVRRRRGSG